MRFGIRLLRHADAQVLGHGGYARGASMIRGHVALLGLTGIEGIVWHHPDGRMAKLKARDLRDDWTPTP